MPKFDGKKFPHCRGSPRDFRGGPWNNACTVLSRLSLRTTLVVGVVVAGAIVGAVREEDVPARFGGEEFVVLLRNPDPGVAVEVGERIRAAVRGLDLRRLGVRPVSVSVGVAVASEPEESIEALIETADRALYRAKRAGRDRVVAA